MGGSRSGTGAKEILGRLRAEQVLRRESRTEVVARSRVEAVLLLLGGLGLWIDHLVLLHGMVRGADGGDVVRRAGEHVIHGDGWRTSRTWKGGRGKSETPEETEANALPDDYGVE